MFNRTTLVVLACAVAAAFGFWAAQHRLALQAQAQQPQLQVVRLFDQPRELPAFSLQQSDGTPLVPGELQGHWTLVFLGFTHCPDVCPTTLAQLAQAQKQWAALPEATRPRLLFVSVDPDRDSPDRVGEYAHAFHKDTLAATADVPALEAFARSLSLVFMKVPAPPGAPADQYSVDHSAAIAVLDPKARMAGVIQHSEGALDAQAIASDLAALARARP
jgi:protein SCO1/2